MTRHPGVSLLLALLAAPAGAQRDSMPTPAPALILEAIARGQRSTSFDGFRARAPGRDGKSYEVFLQGPVNRVATAAAQHRAAGQPYTIDSVYAVLVRPYLAVLALPSPHDRVTARAARQIMLVVKNPLGERTIAPVLVELAPRETFYLESTARASTVRALMATFELSSLPAGDFEVRIIAYGDAVYWTQPIKPAHRARIY